MGIKATVVYDVSRHATIVLRTLSTSISDRYNVTDTIASFSQHCESLRGVARSVTDVSALWGGPPYISYGVVRSRFRAIVIWDEGPGEYDLAYDVHYCLTRLETAVEAVADGIVSGSPMSVAHVYHEAGYALRGEAPIELPDTTDAPAKKPSARSKTLQAPTSSARRSSVSEARKKKSGNILGKLSSAFKNVASADDDRRSSQRPKRPPSSRESSLRAPSENAALSVALYGSESSRIDSAFDDSLGELELPDAVFAWSNFGDPLPNESGDLQWFAHLIRGQDSNQKRSIQPSLRSTESPSVSLSTASTTKNSTQQSAAAMAEKEAPAPLPERDTPVLHTPGIQNSPAISGHGVQPSPVQQSMTASPAVLPTLASGTVSGLSATPNSLSNSTTLSAGVTAALPPLPLSDTSSAASRSTVASLQTGIPSTASATPSSILQSPMLPPSTLQSTSSTSLPPVQPAIAPKDASQTPGLPPALTARAAEDEFDISGLGGFKDMATAGTQTPAQTSQAAGASAGAAGSREDDAVRVSMNNFATTMQAGNFSLALQQVYATLQQLSKLQPRREREVITCANYVLAQKILIRNAVLESEVTRLQAGTTEAGRRQVEAALLTMFLAELKHILPRHRVAAMKVAIEKNLAVGNFGMCARWLRHLVEKAPSAQKALFTQRLQICVANGERNKHMPPSNRLCYVTLQLLTTPYGKCAFCPAVYHPQMAGVVAGQFCPTCFTGSVQAVL